MEPQKTTNSQSNPKEKEQSQRYDTFVLQSYNNPHNMVLEEKQTYRPMEQNCEPRSKHKHIRATNFQQESKTKMKKKKLLQ